MRIGWENEFTGEPEIVRFFGHDTSGSIFWVEADERDVGTEKGGERAEEKIWELIPPAPIELFRPEIVMLAKKKGIGENTARTAVAILIEKGALEVIKKPRPGTKDAEYLRRVERDQKREITTGGVKRAS